MISEESKGLDAHIMAALDAAEAPAQVETPIAAPQDDEAPIEPTEAKAGRDERGRFAAKTESDPLKAPDTTPQADAVTSSEPPLDAKPDTPAAPVWTDGHFRGWSAEKRAKFEALPPEAQAVAMDIAKDLQADFTKKATEAADLRKQADPILSTLQSEADLFAPQGLSPIEAFKNYANIERTLTFGNFDQKMGLIAKICQTYGIPFQEPQDVDPYQASLHDQRASLAQEQARRTAAERQLNSLQQSHIGATIEQFASATNADGTPAHPHFDAVRASMSALLQGGKAQSLKEAYDLAAKPIIDLIEAKTQAALKAANDQRMQAIEKAKKAAPVKSSHSMPSGKTSAKGLDAIISSSLDAAGM